MSNNLPTATQCADIRRQLGICLELAAGIHFLNGVAPNGCDNPMRRALLDQLGDIAKRLGLELVERHSTGPR